jgi:hypothetical protein
VLLERPGPNDNPSCWSLRSHTRALKTACQSRLNWLRRLACAGVPPRLVILG